MKKILVPIEETQRSLKAVAYVKKHYTPEEAEIVLMMIDERLGYSVRTEVETAAIKELEEKLDLIAESFEGYKLTKMSAVGKAGVRNTTGLQREPSISGDSLATSRASVCCQASIRTAFTI